MITINSRTTVQKTFILEAVKSMSNHPTADEIYDEVTKKCPNISKGTVYRNLNTLADSGEILRVPVSNGPDRFDKTNYEHIHCLCLRCQQVFDYDMKYKVIIERTLNPDFTVTGYELLINGYCKDCRNNMDDTQIQ